MGKVLIGLLTVMVGVPSALLAWRQLQEDPQRGRQVIISERAKIFAQEVDSRVDARRFARFLYKNVRRTVELDVLFRPRAYSFIRFGEDGTITLQTDRCGEGGCDGLAIYLHGVRETGRNVLDIERYPETSIQETRLAGTFEIRDPGGPAQGIYWMHLYGQR